MVALPLKDTATVRHVLEMPSALHLLITKSFCVGEVWNVQSRL